MSVVTVITITHLLLITDSEKKVKLQISSKTFALLLCGCCGCSVAWFLDLLIFHAMAVAGTMIYSHGSSDGRGTCTTTIVTAWGQVVHSSSIKLSR